MHVLAVTQEAVRVFDLFLTSCESVTCMWSHMNVLSHMRISAYTHMGCPIHVWVPHMSI